MLVDPWLVGELTFGNQSWIYSGEKMRTRDVDWQAVARESDFILITQVSAGGTAHMSVCRMRLRQEERVPRLAGRLP